MDDLAKHLYRRGISLAKMGMLADAEEALRDAVARAKDPEFADEILGELGDVLEQQGRDDDLIAHYADLCERFPTAVIPLIRYANLCQAAERFPEALQAIDTAIAITPADASLRHLKAAILHDIGDTRQALSCCQEAVRMEAPSTLELSMLGLFAMLLGEYSVAADAYRAAVQLEPGNAEGIRHLGMALQAMGNRTEASEAYQEAMRLDPMNGGARVDLACLQWFEGARDTSRASLEREVALDPHLHFANFSLGAMYLCDRDYLRAIECLRRAIDDFPSSAIPYVYLALAQDGLGNRDAALESLHLARDIDPDNRRPVDLILFFSANRKDPVRAVEIFRTLIARNPDDAHYHYSLGVALHQLDQHVEAEEALNEALRLNPNKADAHYELGLIFDKSGRQSQALASYRRAIEVGEDPGSYFNAACLLWENGDRRLAREHWTKAAELGSGELKRCAEGALGRCDSPSRLLVRALARGCRWLCGRRAQNRPSTS